MFREAEVEVSVAYGIGGSCVACFDRQRLQNASVRSVIEQIAAMPQPDDRARRTAVVLRDVFNSGRLLDVEVSQDPVNDDAAGTPVNLDEALPPPSGDSTRSKNPREIVLRVSEPYRGGTRC